MDADDDSSGSADEQKPSPTTRHDVHRALKNVKFVGSPHLGGAADGSAGTSALPFTPGLSIKGLGIITVPLSNGQATAILDSALSNEISPNVHQIKARDLTIRNPDWEPTVQKLSKDIAPKMGMDPSNLSVKLDRLVYLEEGSSWCSDTKKGKGIIGTLLVQLPSVFAGGLIRVEQAAPEKTEDDEPEGEGTKFSTDMSEFKPYFVSYYKDCNCFIGNIESGNALLLQYSIRYMDNGSLPSAALVTQSMGPLAKSLELLPRANRLLFVPLAKSYADLSLCRGGLGALDHSHKAKADALMMSVSNLSASSSWKILVVQAKRTRKVFNSPNIPTTETDSFEAVYDEHGEIITADMKWMHKIIRLSPIHSDEDESTRVWNDNAMVMCDTGSDIWSETKQSRGGYDHEAYHYRGTFLLAYDQSSEFELKVLTGQKGIADAVENIISTDDHSLVERLLDVIDVKWQCELDSDQCRQLVDMNLQSQQDVSLPLLIRLLLCSPSEEPDVKLWDMIYSMVVQFGWQSMREAVFILLCEVRRKKITRSISSNRTQSRICLPVFLYRVEFLQKLNQIDGQATNAFVESCISKLIEDLTSTDNKRVMDDKGFVPDESLRSVIKESGYDERIIKCTLSHLLENLPVDRMNVLVIVGYTITRLHASNKSDFTRNCLVDFARKFSTGFKADGSIGWLMNTRSKERKADVAVNRRMLITCIRTTLRYATQAQLDCLGEEMLARKDLLPLLLKAVSNDPKCPELFIQDLMNRCLVQHIATIRGHGWNYDNIQVLFQAKPRLAFQADKNGRLLLHHVVSRNDVSYETLEFILAKNPRAAFTRDPVTGMEPFMLAASSDNAAAAHKLLLADPEQVSCALVHVNEQTASKKRKRVVSLD